MEIHNSFYDPDDTSTRFTCQPFVLYYPVKDVVSRCADIGITTMGTPQPTQHLLAELCGLPTIQYWIHLVAWLKRNIDKLNFVHSWCSAHGQELEDYYDHIGHGGLADGLEIMLVSLAIDTRINVVFADMVSSIAVKGTDFCFPTIVWSTVGALPCKVFDPDVGTLADIDTSKTSDSLPEEDWVPHGLLQCKQGGHPLVSTQPVT